MTKARLLKRKKELIKKINDSNQTKWFGVIIAILFCWSIIGLIIGIIIAVSASENKRKYSQEIVEIDYKLSKK